MTTAKEFVEFWLDVSVYADEQGGPPQNEETVRQLADNLLRAAHAQGEQVEELGR